MKVTLRQIANTVGCSVTTVSDALRGQRWVRTETKARVEQAAAALGYQRDPLLSRFMSELKRTGRPAFVATLALINGHRDPAAFANHPTIPAYMKGCRRRAEELGYSFDEFWLHDPKLNAQKWLRMLETRGIPGGILVGLMDDSHVPEPLSLVVQKVPLVVTGVRTRDPVLPFAAVDHHQLALSAVEQALRLGYRRPALVLDRIIDRLIDGRIHAGFLIGQMQLPPAGRIPAFTTIAEARNDPAVFDRWLRRHRPDVLFTLYNEIFDWLERARMKVPADIGVLQLEWRSSRAEIAGFDQRNDRVGEAAVDMIVSLTREREYRPTPEVNAILISPTWRNGSTVAARPAEV